MRITPEELHCLLRNYHRTRPVTFVARTVPELVAGHPWGLAGTAHAVRKLARVNGFVNVGYADAVNRQRLREGNHEVFHAAPRAWGAKVRGPRTAESGERRAERVPLVEYLDRVYLRVKRERILKYQFRDGITDEVIPGAEVLPWLKPRPSESRRQGLRRQVVERTYGLATIRQVKLDDEVYDVLTPEQVADVSGLPAAA